MNAVKCLMFVAVVAGVGVSPSSATAAGVSRLSRPSQKGQSNMPMLKWAGKDKVVNHHNEVPFRVLERKWEYGKCCQCANVASTNSNSQLGNGNIGIGNTSTMETFDNMIIHGDNLAALKSLLPRYEGRVKCIYIDPPYNTGNEGWVYNDNVNDPQIKKWLGEVVGKEGEDFSRHDKWLCMMYPRLRLLQKLLSNDGAIFISIDDNELYNLKLVCDEIFGSNCFIANISWQRTYSTRNDSKGIVSEVEHILAYSKLPGWQPNKLPRTAEMDKKYKNPDNDVAPWKSTDALAPDSIAHQGMVYAIQNPFTGHLIYPTAGRHWAVDQQTILDSLQGWCPYELRDIGDDEKRAEICGVGVDDVRKGVKAIMLAGVGDELLSLRGVSESRSSEGNSKESQSLQNSKTPSSESNINSASLHVKNFDKSRKMAEKVLKEGPWPKYYFMNKGKGGIAKKTYISDVGGAPPTNLWEYKDVGHTDEAKKELMAIFGGKSPFDTPKPVRLIERILKIATDKDAIVLDSFAGSGTTAHAVLNMNKEDGGNRRFILVEMMDYAETVTAERVKRVMEKLAAGEDGLLSLRGVSESRSSDGKSQSLQNSKTPSSESKGILGFGYYELGEPLMNGDVLNENLPAEKIREYVWHTETRGTGNVKQVADVGSDPYLLGVVDETAYYFCYEKAKKVTLNRALLRRLKTKAERYVIYADICLIEAAELKKMNIVFKKIPRDITRL